MTYAELRATLKSLQSQGYAVPPLNSRKEVLKSALESIHLRWAAEAQFIYAQSKDTESVEAKK